MKIRLSNLYRFIAFICIFISISAFADEKKYALIIGNDSYLGDFKSLPTCVNDAREMDKCLSALGYQTTTVLNASRDQMLSAIDKFEALTKQKASVGVFFYSGHAVTINGEPYLIPANTSIKRDNGRLKEYCVGIGSVRQLMKRQCNQSILFLDACRNIVYGDTKGLDNGWEMPDVSSHNKGSRQIICFATALDDVARPGDAKLSPFTKVLTSHIFDHESFQSIWADYIEPEVYELSHQNPTWEGTFTENFYFNPQKIANISANTVQSSNNNVPNTTQKSITINVSPSNAVIRFGDSEYQPGKPLIYKVGSTYTYTVVADGYEPHSGVIKVSQTSPSTVTVNLKKIDKASVLIRCTPNASVSMDGKYIGITPCTIETTSGQHSLSIVKDGYLNYSTKITLTPGENRPYYATLSKEIAKYWDWDGDYEGTQYFSYNFSPKYQIGLSYLYRPEKSRFSYGLYLSASTGLFRGISGISTYSYAYAGVDVTYTVNVNSEIVKYQETSSLVNDKPIDKYSEEIDPNHEAKKYDANALILANFGYNPCNGLLIEAGIGAGFHQDKYYLPYTSYMTKTEVKNLTTGELVGEPKYDYIKGGGDKWFKQDSKWSPAFRLGAKALIPLDDWEKWFITIGGGYTFQFTNMKYSSWDATIGIAWSF